MLGWRSVPPRPDDEFGTAGLLVLARVPHDGQRTDQPRHDGQQQVVAKQGVRAGAVPAARPIIRTAAFVANVRAPSVSVDCGEAMNIAAVTPRNPDNPTT